MGAVKRSTKNKNGRRSPKGVEKWELNGRGTKNVKDLCKEQMKRNIK